MADWDTTSPADTDIVSQFPANERAARAAGKTNFGVDHREADDGDVGKHERVSLLAQPATPATDAGSGILFTKTVSGTVELFWLDSAGEVSQLTSDGAIQSSLLESTTSTPSTDTDRGKVYTRVINGTAELFYLDSDGNEIRLTEKGEILVNFQETDLVVNSIRTKSFSRGTVIDLGAVSGTVELDWSAGTTYRFSHSTDITVTLVGMPDAAAKEDQVMYFDMEMSGDRSVTVNSAYTLEHPNQTAGVLVPDARNVVMALTDDGSSIILITIPNVGVPA